MKRIVLAEDPFRVPPLRIGGLTIEVPFILAPMAGYTDAALRTLCRRHGCGLGFTEVVNAQGLLHGSRPTFHLLETFPQERPVAAHIYGCDPAEMAAAARLIEGLERFDLIDINCGCPVRKIVAKGCGAALMGDPPRIGRIVEAVRAAVRLPVTVKTRIGLAPDRDNISEIARIVEASGGHALFVHARYASRRHGGPADWDALARIKRERSIPVVGNGGVTGADEAICRLRSTGVDGVMIARGAIGNPWIFRDIRCRLDSGTPVSRTEGEFRAVIMEQFEMMVRLHEKAQVYRRRKRFSAEQSAALHFRGHLHQYFKGLRGWGDVRRRLHEMNTGEKIAAAIDELMARSAMEA